MFNKSIIIILLLIILGFAISLYALLIQVFGIESDDKATLISGVLSMIGAMIGAIVAGGIAIFISRTQITNQAELDDKRERQLIAIKIKLEKYQDLTRIYYETGVNYSKWFALIINFRQGELTRPDLKTEDAKIQNIILNNKTTLRSYAPFLDKLIDSVEALQELESDMGNKIYDNFTYPINKNIEESKLIEVVEEIIEINKDILLHISKQIKELNELIKIELEKINQEQ